jgi:hypothetical protein
LWVFDDWFIWRENWTERVTVWDLTLKREWMDEFFLAGSWLIWFEFERWGGGSFAFFWVWPLLLLFSTEIPLD